MTSFYLYKAKNALIGITPGRKSKETPEDDEHKIQNGGYFWRGARVGEMRIGKGTQEITKVIVMFLMVSSLYNEVYFIVTILIFPLCYFVCIVSKQKTKQKVRYKVKHSPYFFPKLVVFPKDQSRICPQQVLTL